MDYVIIYQKSLFHGQMSIQSAEGGVILVKILPFSTPIDKCQLCKTSNQLYILPNTGIYLTIRTNVIPATLRPTRVFS